MITSSSNPQIRRVIQLNTKARARRDEACFPAEGIRIFREIPAELRRQVYVSATFMQDPAHRRLLLDEGVALPTEVGNTDDSGRKMQCTAEMVDDRIFRQMCDTQTPQGILTIASIPTYSREQLLTGSGKKIAKNIDEKHPEKRDSGLYEENEAPLVLVLEDLQDPGNVGTIIRTAEGAGVTGVFMSGRTADCFQPKVVRSTMGSIFRVPIRREASLPELMNWLKERGVRSFAAHLSGKNSYVKEDYRGGTAFLIGNEGNGLSDELTACADVRIRIPMEGKVESLNAAVAAALLMYEAHAQRHD